MKFFIVKESFFALFSLNVFESKNKSLLFIKKGFFLFSFVFLFSFEPAFGFQCIEAEKEKECKKAVSEAEQACKGMDMASYAMVGQATQGAVSAVESGGSAKLAHEGNAAINSALSSAALKRCAECESAMNHCMDTACAEERCRKEGNDLAGECKPTTEASVKKSCRTCKDYDGGKQVQQERQQCAEAFDEKREECAELKTYRDQACLQGGLSGIQAATSLLAAQALGDCPEGAENCIKIDGEKGKEKVKIAVDPSMPGSAGFPEFSLANPWENKKADSSQEALLPPDDVQDGANQIAENADEKSKGNGGKEGSELADSSDGALGSLAGLGAGPGSSGTDSQAFNYGKRPSGFGSAGLIAGNTKDEEEWVEEEEEYPRSLSSSGGFGSSGSGGYVNDSSFNGGRSQRGAYGSKLAGNKKLALNKKTDTFGKGKAGETIFTQMSRFIKKVCYREMRCP